MKLNRWDRLGIAAGAALNLLLLAFAFGCAIAPGLAESAGGGLCALLRRHFALRLLLMAVSALLAAALYSQARLFVRSRKQPGSGASEPEAAAFDLGAEGEGRVQISGAALEALVRRSLGPAEGIEQYDVKLTQGKNGLDIALGARVRQGVKLSSLARAARENVRRALEDMAGVKVDCVTLLVTEVVPDAAETPSWKEKAAKKK